MMDKSSIRAEFKKKRAALSFERREEASRGALRYLKNWVEATLSPSHKEKRFCLSFASFKDEIDIWPFNEYLLTRGLLALPKIEVNHLAFYEVKDKKDLILINQIVEPDPQKCRKLNHNDLFGVLVPALAIDDSLHRLGFGRGFYDRLLATLPKTPHIGIAFKEQHYVGQLPSDPHDVQLTQRLLF